MLGENCLACDLLEWHRTCSSSSLSFFANCDNLILNLFNILELPFKIFKLKQKKLLRHRKTSVFYMLNFLGAKLALIVIKS